MFEANDTEFFRLNWIDLANQFERTKRIIFSLFTCRKNKLREIPTHLHQWRQQKPTISIERNAALYRKYTCRW